MSHQITPQASLADRIRSAADVLRAQGVIFDDDKARLQRNPPPWGPANKK